jgi:HlyD family secretion protein
VKQAELTYGNTKIEFDRELALFDKGVIAKAEFQKYELALKQAKEELDAAQNNLSIVRDGVNKEAATASNTIVSSTIDGMILYVPVKVGHSVIEMNTFSPGTSIATVADMGEMEFQGKVDETEVGKIKNGMPLLITIGAIDGVQFDATLTYISPKGILENGAIQFDIKANVTLRNDFFIRSGYSANADIVIARKDSVLSIEEKNVIFDNMKTFVELRIDSTTFKKIPVELGISDGIYTEITKGLSLTDKVKVQQ